MTERQTIAEKRQNYVSYHECEAMYHLARAGRTVGDIAFMLERKPATVKRHATNECDHS